MQHEFDNTFEALLRRAALGKTSEVSPKSVEHLDADAFSAFAENVLPAETRASFAAHLADCADCRQILANIALIQEAEETETFEEKATIPAQTSWRERFKRWFALPTLGYAAAALTVLFVGVFAFVAIQSKQRNEAVQVAQFQPDEIEKEAERKRRSARPVEAPPPEQTPEQTPEATPEMQANLSDLNNANSGENSNSEEQSPNRGLPPGYRVQPQASATETPVAARREQPEPLRETTNRAANVSNTVIAANTAALPSSNVAAKPSPEKPSALIAAAPVNSGAAKNANAAESRAADAQISANQENKQTAAASARNAINARIVGNKTFQNLDGVWRDSTYNGQATTNVARGSDEYKKLDAGLRSIAESFGNATVIVVWQGKAYRIR